MLRYVGVFWEASTASPRPNSSVSEGLSKPLILKIHFRMLRYMDFLSKNITFDLKMIKTGKCNKS